MNKPCCQLQEKFMKKAGTCDYLLSILSLLTLGVMLSSLFPTLIEFSPLVLLIIAIIFGIKPLITLFKK
ncbi:MAG: hypothetical protein DDT40_01520 [candidate division WS2 bacterium]|uniref:Uncharacterized protein n=1 Tax=Psychracetigena formicireducens TaxID=2986056 RepID=A0A9E2F7I0_PSYF1|nr:hypothetical protein [Candidatus Psychracetigena formicireducens]MBT9145603.1 hypothetical protein [Candidatus Psychracetigena formicireducens]MBT9151329.1 hypothetical protein [Candidatus Psychracetigena formicireducens]